MLFAARFAPLREMEGEAGPAPRPLQQQKAGEEKEGTDEEPEDDEEPPAAPMLELSAW